MVWTGSENMVRDYLWIEDLCSVIMTLVRGGVAAGAYNVTSEENYSTREVIDIIQSEMGTNLPILYRDKKFSEIRYQSMDGSKLRNELGFGPSTKLRDGIRKMLDK
jgi:nucleoside-diphosphate-sugar epimerase